MTTRLFGQAISATDDTLVVGAPESSVVALGGPDVGRAYVFRSASGTVDPGWQLQTVLEGSSSSHIAPHSLGDHDQTSAVQALGIVAYFICKLFELWHGHAVIIWYA